MNLMLKSIWISTFVFLLSAACVITSTAQETRGSAADFYKATKAAPAAFKAGDMSKAALLSHDLLKQAELWKDDWNYGNAIHVANLVLGRIALLNKEPDKARVYLLNAGRTPGSPQLNSFGPNMLLASEMLKIGESEAVLEYFDLCAKFWSPENSLLEVWKADIKNGNAPDFGANLRYLF
jgi:hypothetical protein